MKNKLFISLLVISALMLSTLNAQNKNQRVTIHAVENTLPDVLAILADKSGYNIVTGPNVNDSELLTIHLDDVDVE